LMSPHITMEIEKQAKGPKTPNLAKVSGKCTRNLGLNSPAAFTAILFFFFVWAGVRGLWD
jgi:hypothetical protein